MSSIRDLVAEELGTAVEPRVEALAAAIAAKHGAASMAVLFYGSCLRERQLDGLMLDFYLIVTDYRTAYDRRWLAAANRIIPPNVFYFEKDGLAAKYAVLSASDFRRECGPQAWTVSTAARFAQPSRLVWSADGDAAAAVTDAVAAAAPTLLGWARPVADGARGAELFKRAFALTYAAELRPERSDRSSSIVDADTERYRRFAQAAGEPDGSGSRRQAERWWRRMQRRGKWYSVPRIAKGSLTFTGGVDYIAWKINRHAGADIQVRPWHRRWPILAAVTFLPRLLRSGAVR